MNRQGNEQRSGGETALRVDARGSALLVIDVQSRLAAAMEPQALAALERNVVLLIDLASRLGWPVVVSEQYPRGLGPTVPSLAAALEQSQAAEARAGGSATPGKVVRFTKTAFACTEEEGFDGVLAELGRRQWVVAGMEAHVCVWQTVRGLLARGLSVHVPEDAVLSRTAANQRVGLRLCERAGAVVTSTETVAFDALVRAGSEDFKAISRQVR